MSPLLTDGPSINLNSLMATNLLEQDAILKEIVRRIVSTFQPELIYLFGSRARGEAGSESDYDLLVVVSSSPLPRYRRNQLAFRALCGVGASKDVIVLTSPEFEAKKSIVCSLAATVLREGVLLHAA